MIRGDRRARRGEFYRGAAKAARQYIERDCARYDDYYLAEGTGVAMRFVAQATGDGEIDIEKKSDMDGDTYEAGSPGWTSTVQRALGHSSATTTLNTYSPVADSGGPDAGSSCRPDGAGCPFVA